MKPEYWIGFDLGGTKMIAAMLDKNLQVLHRIKKRTDPHEGNSAVLKRIVSTVDEVITQSGVPRESVGGTGLAVPGPMDREAGIIIDTPNLGFRNVSLRSYVEHNTGLKVVLENDVSAGTYGEYLLGAGKGYSNLMGVFLGTGIGGGLIINGRLYRGASGNAGEIGHMIIQTDGPLCGCGHQGCVEALASRLSISKDAVALAAIGKAPAAFADAGTDITAYKSSIFKQAWKQKDPAIRNLILRSAHYLGIGLANAVNLLNPEAIILGGGLIEKLGRTYIRAATESMQQHAQPGLAEDVTILPSKLGDDAVLAGAAALAMEELSQ